MTALLGLAAHSVRMDDTPQVRGAVAFCKAAAAACRETDEGVNYTPLKAAIDNHAWLAIRGAYRSRDARNGTR